MLLKLKLAVAVACLSAALLLASASPVAGQTRAAKKRFSVAVGISRSAPFADACRNWRRGQFAASVSVSIPVGKRLSFNVGVSQPLDSRPPAVRGGISFRLY